MSAGYEPWRIAISDEDTRTGPELGGLSAVLQIVVKLHM